MATRSVNKVILLGHLGRDAETRFTPSGVSVSRFSIATNRRVKDSQTGDWKDETDWHNVTMWRNENLATFLTKGKQVYIEGRLQTRSYDDKDGQKRYATDVIVEEIILLSGRGEGGPSGMDEGGWGESAPAQRPPVSAPRSSRPAPTSQAEPPMPDMGDDDVPF